MAPIVKRTSLGAAMAPLYKTAIAMVTTLQTRFAASLFSLVTSARDADVLANSAVNQSEQFSIRMNNRPVDNATAANEHDDVSEDAPFVYQMNNGSSRVWTTPSCRPMQNVAVERSVFKPECEGKVLIVDRTGGGKSHILRMAATFVGGIVVVIVPLLALTADQMSKIDEAVQDCGSVKAVHLDELSKQAITDEVVPRMHSIGYDSESTLFLFTSPQKLATTPAILDALFVCHARETLRLVTIDEAHLYAQHGSTFRDELRVLTTIFFAVVFKEGAAYHPLFLAMTATMTKPLLVKLSELTNVPWTEKKHQLWANADAFKQRYIKVTFQVRDHMSREAFPSLVDHLKANPNSSAFVFVNFRNEVKKCETKLEEMLIAAKLDIDIITIHGDMEKHDKFGFIKLFTGALFLPDFKPNICISTAAASTGIDKATINMVIRMGTPRDVVTSFQERGRNARQPGMTGVYSITTDWIMYVKLLMTIILPPATEKDTPEYKEVNSAITTPNARSSKRQRNDYRMLP